MNNQKKIDKTILTLLIILIFSGSFGIRCARPSTPIGGPKDTTPPIVKKILPNNYARNLKPKEVVFEFNEFMQVKDAHKNVVFSPPLNIRPVVEVKGRKIVTTFDREVKFEDNTTYFIDYGSAIQDINEGNAARQLKYVFSTGNSIDSLAMSGLAVNAKTGDTIINALVFLYDKISDTVKLDSTLYNGKILGQFKTDSLGVYFASHLKSKDYRVYVVEDTDNNGVYTPGKDKVGFIDSSLNPSKLEPFKIWFDPISREVFASSQVTFRLFSEKAYTPQSIKETKLVEECKILFLFSSTDAKIGKVEIEDIPQENIILMPSLHKDSLTVWIRSNGIIMPDTLRGTIEHNGIDTLGKISMIKTDFELAPRFVDKKALKKQEKKLAKKNKLPFWQRFLNWFKFRQRRQQKLALKQQKIRQQQILDSLKNNPEALAQLRMDSLRLDSLRVDSIRLDSLRQDSLQRFKLDSLSQLKLFIDPMNDYNPKNDLIISTKYPLDSIRLDSMQLFRYSAVKKGEDYFDSKQAATGKAEQEKFVEKFTLEQDTLDFRRYKVISNWLADSEYEFNIVPKAFVDILGKSNDTIIHKFKTVSARKTTTIEITAQNVAECYILEIVSESGKTEFSHIVKQDSVYMSKLLPVGKYRIKITKDDNCNGVFDDGNLVHRVMPEPIDFYKNEKGMTIIETKENFEFNISIDFSALFGRKSLKPILNNTKIVPKEEKTDE